MLISYYFDFVRQVEEVLRNTFMNDIQDAKLEFPILKEKNLTEDDDPKMHNESKFPKQNFLIFLFWHKLRSPHATKMERKIYL